MNFSSVLSISHIIITYLLDRVSSIKTYEEANLGRQMLSNISLAHFEEPTAIQRYAIPCIQQ